MTYSAYLYLCGETSTQPVDQETFEASQEEINEWLTEYEEGDRLWT